MKNAGAAVRARSSSRLTGCGNADGVGNSVRVNSGTVACRHIQQSHSAYILIPNRFQIMDVIETKGRGGFHEHE
jgi:hypothetical protein